MEHWIQKNKTDPEKYIESRKKLNKTNERNRRKIICLNNKNEIVMIYDSMRHIRLEGFKIRNVFACLNGKRKTHRDFRWKYFKESETEK